MNQKILYFLVILTPIIDTLNGFIIDLGLNSPLGKVYRLITILFFLWALITNTKLNMKFIFGYLILGYFIVNPLILYLSDQDIAALKENFDFSYKIFLFLISIFAFTKITKNKNIHFINKMISISEWIVPSTVVIPYFLGIGNNTYLDYAGNPVGFKAFYFSNNALNVVLIVLLIFSMDQMYKTKGKELFTSGIKFLLILLSIILIGSKSSLVISAIMGLIYLGLFLKKLSIFKIVISFLAGIIVLFIFRQQISDIIQLQFFMIKNNNFLTYLLSGRNGFMNIGFDVFNNNLNIFTLFFGLGNHEMVSQIGYRLSGLSHYTKGVEMDFFDLYFNMGLMGLSIVLCTMLFFIIKCRKASRYNPSETRPYKYAFISLLVFSFLGGHVITEAFSITYFSLVLTGIYTIVSNEKNNFKQTYKIQRAS